MQFSLNRTSLTLFGALLIPLMVAMALFSLLMIKKYENLEKNFIEDNYLVYIDSVFNNFQIWLYTGNSLDTAPNKSNIFEALINSIQGIKSIELINENGVVLFSTDSSLINDKIKDKWLNEARSNKVALFRQSNIENNFVGKKFVDTDGNFAGMIIASYDKDLYVNKVNKIAYKIIFFNSIILIIMVFILIYYSNKIFAHLTEKLNILKRSFQVLNKDIPATDDETTNAEVIKKLENYDLLMHDKRLKMLALDYAEK